MRAVVYDEVGGPEVLHLAEVPTPEPAADEVLVRVLAVAVDFIQLHIRHGGSGRIGSPKEPAYGLAPLPRIPGGTACVEVVECGAAVDNVAVGERHLVGGLRPGSYVEYGVVSAGSLSLGTPNAPGPTAIPAKFGPVEAAAFDYAPVAYHTLRVAAGLSAGETVLIHSAAGGTGVLAVQLAKHFGATVIGRGEQRREAGSRGVTWSRPHDQLPKRRRDRGDAAADGRPGRRRGLGPGGRRRLRAKSARDGRGWTVGEPGVELVYWGRGWWSSGRSG